MASEKTKTILFFSILFFVSGFLILILLQTVLLKLTFAQSPIEPTILLVVITLFIAISIEYRWGDLLRDPRSRSKSLWQYFVACIVSYSTLLPLLLAPNYWTRVIVLSFFLSFTIGLLLFFYLTNKKVIGTIKKLEKKNGKKFIYKGKLNRLAYSTTNKVLTIEGFPEYAGHGMLALTENYLYWFEAPFFGHIQRTNIKISSISKLSILDFSYSGLKYCGLEIVYGGIRKGNMDSFWGSNKVGFWGDESIIKKFKQLIDSLREKQAVAPASI